MCLPKVVKCICSHTDYISILHQQDKRFPFKYCWQLLCHRLNKCCVFTHYWQTHYKELQSYFVGQNFGDSLKDRHTYTNCRHTKHWKMFMFDFTFWTRYAQWNQAYVYYFSSVISLSVSRIGASIVGRLGSWIGTISVSLQGALGMVYIGEILLKSVPFTQCEVEVCNVVLHSIHQILQKSTNNKRIYCSIDKKYCK